MPESIPIRSRPAISITTSSGKAVSSAKGSTTCEAFESACEGRFPDNRLLSHDLIEGCFARSGLINDVELFEGVPSRLLVDMNRRHRWIRGDWQIASWLGNRVPTLRGNSANPLSGLSRWKILDNLRRSLTPPLLLGFLVLGWLLAPALAGAVHALGPRPGLWPGQPCGPARRASPAGRQALDAARRRRGAAVPADVPRRGRGPVHPALHGALSPRCHRPHALSFSSFPKTLVGMDHRQRGGSALQREFARALRNHGGLRVSSVLAGRFAAGDPASGLLVAGPLLLAWLAGPLIAWRISLALSQRGYPGEGRGQRQLRRWARQTWHYFETFVGRGRQLAAARPRARRSAPRPSASRTSPTNIGLALLSGLTAYDLGYLPAGGFLDRTSRTLHSMLRLERHRGHFYNWYNTRTLQPAEPRYVSSVDSGNLWGALTVLSAGLEELRNRPLIPPRLLEGLQDTVEVIADLHRGQPLRQATTRSTFALPDCAGVLRRRCPAERGKPASGCAGFASGRRIWRHRFRPISRFEGMALALCDKRRAHRHLSRLAFWTEFTRRQRPAGGRTSVRPRCAWPGSVVSRLDDSLRFLPPPRALAVKAAARAAAWGGPRNERNRPDSAFERLDAGCTLGQVLQAAEQIAEGHAWQAEAA